MSSFRIILFLLAMLMVNNSYCQKTQEEDYAKEKSVKKKKEPFSDRLVYGGNIGGYLGTSTYLQLNPMVGYRTLDWWVNGVGLDFTYIKFSGLEQVIYGPNIWSRAYLLDYIILQTEVEQLYFKISDRYGNSYRDQVPLWLVGGGYRSDGGLSITVLFDLLQRSNSPYGGMPIVRIGGLFGGTR